MSTISNNLDIVDKTQIVAQVVEALNLKTIAAKSFVRYTLANCILFDNKQADYGSRNISTYGLFGIVVRCTDKFERLKTLFSKGRRRKAVNESILDSFRDISNYSIIAIMVEKNDWPAE